MKINERKEVARRCVMATMAILDSDAPNAVELAMTPNCHKGTNGMTDDELVENYEILRQNHMSIV